MDLYTLDAANHGGWSSFLPVIWIEQVEVVFSLPSMSEVSGEVLD